MKNFILLAAFIIGNTLYAQNDQFSRYTSNADLLKVKNNLNSNDQKKEFYKQYLRNRLVDDMNTNFVYKNYSKAVLRKFADTIISNSIPCDLNEFSGTNETQFIANLDRLTEQNNPEEFDHNLCGLLGNIPEVVNRDNESEHTAFEELPADILQINFWGGGNMTTQKFYKISGENLMPVNAVAENEGFLKKIGRYAPAPDHFSFYNINGECYIGFERKLTDGYYVISGMLFLESEAVNPLYVVEYKTKDFRNFIPVRIKENDEKAKWRTIP